MVCPEHDVDFVLERLRARREVGSLLTRNDSLADFKPDLILFIEQGLNMVGAVDPSAAQLQDPKTRPGIFPPELLEELVTLIVEAFQQPLSLGESLFAAAVGHMQKNLYGDSKTLDVFKRLQASLRVERPEEAAVAEKKQQPAVAKPKPKTRPVSPKPKRKIVESKPEQPEGISLQAAKEAEIASKDESVARKVPKEVDVSQIVAMAGRLAPRMDVDTVREVQSMVSTDFREIMAHAKGMGYPGIKMSEEETKAIHFMWMMYCHGIGSCQKAEQSVLRRLRKKEPGLALLLYGPEALIEVDPRTGLRILKHGQNDQSKTMMDDYLALDAVLERTKQSSGSQKNTQCGITGLLQGVFGEFDYAQMVTDELVNLSPDAKKRLIQNLMGKVPKEELEQLKNGNLDLKHLK